MFCKPPHPVYIVLFRGDDTDFVGNQEIIVKITTERDISGCKAYFKYMGNIQTFDEIPQDKELHLVFSREQTNDMPLGTWDAELYLIDENGKRMTVNNRIHMLVTNSVREAYFPDDPQSVSVVISANKYIEDAEVSADGKTLTLTKKDGTEVSFSGGGGGGTNDYNDLENKPSINGATLTGNVNLATPEQLLLKADKTNVYTKTEVDEKLAEKADEFTPWMFAGETAGYDNLSVVIESVYEGAAFDYKLYSGGTFIAGFTDSSDSLTVAYFITIDATKRITATRKRILYTGGSVSIGESTGGGGTIEVKGNGSSIKKDGKEVATEESLAPEYSTSSAYAVGAFVYHDGNIYQCTTAIADGGEAWNAAHWELRKLDDFFTESNSLLTATIDARLPYPINAVPSTGVLKDRTLNTTSLASVTVPDNFTDLLIRASVASSLSVTMPEAITTKYGDTFPGEAGEYLITITKTGVAEAYVRTIKLEVANA